LGDVTSSKTVCRKRRQAANSRLYRRLRKSGRVPQHSRAERLRAEAERRVQRAVEQRHEKWRRRIAGVAVAGVGGSAFVFTPVSGEQITAGRYPDAPLARYYAAVTPSADRSELPHMPEPDGTYWTGYDGSGSTTPTIRVGPTGLVWYGYGPNLPPNIFGD
jgi:hypothetical protein